MSERMTDERLAEIETQTSFEYLSDAEELCDELLQALKAEREYAKELKEQIVELLLRGITGGKQR